jgi:hypothetical protein
MTRSTGRYPSYVKISLDPELPPDGWNEGIRRCMSCKKAWPNLGIFSPSPCCNVHAGISMGEELHPDMTWSAAVKALLIYRFEKYYERWNEGLSDEDLVNLGNGVPYSDIKEKDIIGELEDLLELDSSCEI